MGRLWGLNCLFLLLLGTHCIEVSAWRPIGQSIVSRLRRFFVGGTPQLEDATFAMIPSDFQAPSPLSRPVFSLNLETYLVDSSGFQ
ncbi:unnamed protein product [Schistocephalus solidus]|uniref:BPI2 domain-containing protein n=1 Tax=Schistocephalus solidus TaxID=70667 RepID=A0A183S948_SCHSO|nr:unnamed protein product [Schistocephalus solidus]